MSEMKALLYYISLNLTYSIPVHFYKTSHLPLTSRNGHQARISGSLMMSL